MVIVLCEVEREEVQLPVVHLVVVSRVVSEVVELRAEAESIDESVGEEEEERGDEAGIAGVVVRACADTDVVRGELVVVTRVVGGFSRPRETETQMRSVQP